MRHLIVITLTFGLATTSGAENNELKFNWSWETAFSNQYLLPEGMVAHDGPVVENELSLSFGDSGWYAGIWSAFPFEKTAPIEEADEEETEAPVFENEVLGSLYAVLDSTKQIYDLLNPTPAPAPPFSGEVDIFVGYERDVLDGRLRLRGQLAYYMIGDLGDLGDDQWVASVYASLPKFPVVQPYVEVEYFGEISNASPKAGVFCFAGFTKNLPLDFHLGDESEEQTLDFDLRFAWSDGAWGMESGFIYGRITASTEFRLGENWYLSPSLVYQISGSSQDGDPWDYVDGNQFVARLACGFKF